MNIQAVKTAKKGMYIGVISNFYYYLLFTFNSRLEAHVVIYNGKK